MHLKLNIELLLIKYTLKSCIRYFSPFSLFLFCLTTAKEGHLCNNPNLTKYLFRKKILYKHISCKWLFLFPLNMFKVINKDTRMTLIESVDSLYFMSFRWLWTCFFLLLLNYDFRHFDGVRNKQEFRYLNFWF